MEYKQGDKIRIRKDLTQGTSYGTSTFVSNMEKFKGEEVTVYVNDSVRNGFWIEEDGGMWWWSYEMIEGLSSPRTEERTMEDIDREIQFLEEVKSGIDSSMSPNEIKEEKDEGEDGEDSDDEDSEEDKEESENDSDSDDSGQDEQENQESEESPQQQEQQEEKEEDENVGTFPERLLKMFRNTIKRAKKKDINNFSQSEPKPDVNWQTAVGKYHRGTCRGYSATTAFNPDLPF
jgi:TATA-binding protein-associated factor Taf7